MKLLTFLGTGDYRKTTYHWKEKNKYKTTRLFPVALADWLKPDEVLVFLTDAAKEHVNWRELDESLAATPVSIANGKNEAELWQIFDSIVGCVEPGDELVIDITHGFRSLPLLGLLAAAYLRSSKGVAVKHLLYGAYEAGDKKANETPVFELTSFLSLFDWMVASDHFLRTGFGTPLAELLSEESGAIGELRKSILDLSDGLQLLRPNAVVDSAAKLVEDVKKATPEVSKTIPPLENMLKHISESYGQFAGDPDDPIQVLDAQLKMVAWCCERHQFVQSLALAREWLPSLLCMFFKVDAQDGKERSDMELLLAGGKMGPKESPRRSEWTKVPAGKRLQKLWNDPPHKLANLRNDVLHAGFRKAPKEPEEIKRTAREVAVELKAIWNEFKQGLN